MAETKIEWADRVWNPTVGCRRVSAGCQNCYAERFARRLAAMGRPEYKGLLTQGRWDGAVRTLPERLNEPLSWKKPARVFVDSMSDLFHENVPVSFIAAVFEIMASWRLICRKRDCGHGDPECYEDPGHTYLILTKRPERMKAVLLDELPEYVSNYYPGDSALSLALAVGDWPLKNVWLGVSVENQAAADERIPLLLETPAAVRFISAEPLLGPVDLAAYLEISECGEKPNPMSPSWRFNGRRWEHHHGYPIGHVETKPNTNSGLHWIIVGGESGPGARPMHPEWVRSIRDQCMAAGIPLFFKQWGAWTPEDIPGKRVAISRRDGAIGDHWGIYRFRSGAYARAESRDDTAFMVRVGKHRAGRILDGREWDQYPETGS